VALGYLGGQVASSNLSSGSRATAKSKEGSTLFLTFASFGSSVGEEESLLSSPSFNFGELVVYYLKNMPDFLVKIKDLEKRLLKLEDHL